MNQGARLLKSAPGTQGAKARRLHVSPAFLSQLATGKRVPGHDLRLTIEANWGVPYGSWEVAEEVADVPSSVPSLGASAVVGGDALPATRSESPGIPGMSGGTVGERARALLAYLSVPGRSPADLAQARELRHALTLEARLVGAMFTKAKIHEHPDWPALVEQLVVALARVPGALDALDAYLAGTEDAREERAAA